MSDEMLYLILFLGWSLTGFIFIGVALHTKRYERKRERIECSLAVGTIVDSVEKVHHSKKVGTVRYYVPVIAFSANNVEYRLENECGCKERDHILIGKSVDVMYDESEPTHFHLAEDFSNQQPTNRILRYGILIVLGAAVLTAVCYANHVF